MLVDGAVRYLGFSRLNNHLVAVGSIGSEEVLIDVAVGPAVFVWFIIKKPGVGCVGHVSSCSQSVSRCKSVSPGVANRIEISSNWSGERLERTFDNHLCFCKTMIRKVVTRESTNTGSILNRITVKTTLVLIHRDSLIIKSHVWSRRVSRNSVRSWSRRCKRIIIVKMSKTRIFTPAPACPTAVVTMAIIVAFSAFFGCKSTTDTGPHCC